MSDGSDARAPVTIFTFFLELNRALPVRSGEMHISYVDGGEEWSGWTDADVAELLGMEVEGSPAGSVPHTSMIARHLTEPEPAPLSRVEATFGDWGMQGLVPPDTANRPSADPTPGRKTIDVVKSVLALTRFVPQSAHPPGRELTVGALQRIMFDGFDHLNALLEPLGFVAGRWEIGAITLADIPAEVAVLVDNTGNRTGGRRELIAFVTEVHDGYPTLAGELNEDDGSIAHEAIGYHGGDKGGGQPFLEVLRFIHAAEGERLIGDRTRALVDLNTAVELLIRLVLYYGHAATGVPEEEALRANRAVLMVKVKNYLPELLGRKIDIEDPGNPWGAWFGDGYKLRHRAVHEGELLDYDAVERAFDQASELIGDLKRSLMANEQLRALGEQIEVEPLPRDQRITSGLLNIEFPWD